MRTLKRMKVSTTFGCENKLFIIFEIYSRLKLYHKIDSGEKRGSNDSGQGFVVSVNADTMAGLHLYYTVVKI